MPHVLLEISNNMIERDNLPTLFEQIHQLLTIELPTELESCKSRAIIYDRYYIGSGSIQNAFVHLDVKILPGRAEKHTIQINQKLLNISKHFFSQSSQELNVTISVNTSELKTNYCKWNSGK